MRQPSALRAHEGHDFRALRAAACFLLVPLFAPACAKEAIVKTHLEKTNQRLSGRVLVPALLYMAGVPFGIVLLLWFFFFRG